MFSSRWQRSRNAPEPRHLLLAIFQPRPLSRFLNAGLPLPATSELDTTWGQSKAAPAIAMLMPCDARHELTKLGPETRVQTKENTRCCGRLFWPCARAWRWAPPRWHRMRRSHFFLRLPWAASVVCLIWVRLRWLIFLRWLISAVFLTPGAFPLAPVGRLRAPAWAVLLAAAMVCLVPAVALPRLATAAQEAMATRAPEGTAMAAPAMATGGTGMDVMASTWPAAAARIPTTAALTVTRPAAGASGFATKTDGGSQPDGTPVRVKRGAFHAAGWRALCSRHDVATRRRGVR